MIEVGHVVIGAVDQVGERVRLVTEALQSARWPLPSWHPAVHVTPPQVMKRVRTEQIQMAVSCYLKRRQYGDADGPLKQGLRLSQSTEEMAASLAGTLPLSQRQQLAQVPLWKPIMTCPPLESQGLWAVPDVVCDFLLPWTGAGSSLPSCMGPSRLTWASLMEGQVLQDGSFGKWLGVLASYAYSWGLECVSAFIVWNCFEIGFGFFRKNFEKFFLQYF